MCGTETRHRGRGEAQQTLCAQAKCISRTGSSSQAKFHPTFHSRNSALQPRPASAGEHLHGSVYNCFELGGVNSCISPWLARRPPAIGNRGHAAFQFREVLAGSGQSRQQARSSAPKHNRHIVRGALVHSGCRIEAEVAAPPAGSRWSYFEGLPIDFLGTSCCEDCFYYASAHC